MNIGQEARAMLGAPKESTAPTQRRPGRAYRKVIDRRDTIERLANDGHTTRQIAGVIEVDPVTLLKYLASVCGDSVAETVRQNGIEKSRTARWGDRKSS